MNDFALRNLLFCCTLLGGSVLRGQQYVVEGWLRDRRGDVPLSGIRVFLKEGQRSTTSDALGGFSLTADSDTLQLHFSGPGLLGRELRVPRPPGKRLQLGVVYMESAEEPAAEAGLVYLPGTPAEGEEDWEEGSSLLGLGRDLFLRRASFDFSAAFFRLRGFDNRERALYFNGYPLNSAYDGRPQWNVLGGLTDIGRNTQEFIGRRFAPYGFGGIMGLRNIIARPSSLRPGNRITLSAANRTYRWRQMYSYNSGATASRKGYLLSFAHRSGHSGYFEGTPYRSLSGFAAAEWQVAPSHRFELSGIFNHFKRGQTSPLAAEVRELHGRRYNPNWGWHGGDQRSARERLGFRPLLIGAYRFSGKRLQVRASLGYHWGSQSRTRLSYFDAANPSPVYYRNLPSFYYNATAGPNYANALRARDALLSRPQLDWQGLVGANRTAFPDGQAVYLYKGDERQQSEWAFRATLSSARFRNLRLDAGMEARVARWDFRGRILDLLGAAYHFDRDPFTDTRNDTEGPLQKGEGDLFGYSYRLEHVLWHGFMQAWWAKDQWEAGLALRYSTSRLGRDGKFRNERYPGESFGPGPEQAFTGWGAKAGLGFRISGRAWLQGFFGLGSRPPLPRDVYIDPRQHNRTFPKGGNEELLGGSLNLHLRHPRLKGRLTAYWQRFTGGRSLRSYFTEAGFGSAFVREAIGGLGSIHQGLEWGLEFQLKPAVRLHCAGTFGKAVYTDAARAWLYTDPVRDRPEAFSEAGLLDAGRVRIDGNPLPRGPQTALSLGFGYRDPEYWWLDLRGIFMDRRYLSPAYLRYTEGFLEGSETEGELSALPRAGGGALLQEQLAPVYLLNLSLGKSWLKGGHYVSAFIGLNNLFDLEFRTGGYHQGRLATRSGLMQDQASGQPSFGPKYFNAYGRTFFINISWSF